VYRIYGKKIEQIITDNYGYNDTALFARSIMFFDSAGNHVESRGYPNNDTVNYHSTTRYSLQFNDNGLLTEMKKTVIVPAESIIRWETNASNTKNDDTELDTAISVHRFLYDDQGRLTDAISDDNFDGVFCADAWLRRKYSADWLSYVEQDFYAENCIRTELNTRYVKYYLVKDKGRIDKYCRVGQVGTGLVIVHVDSIGRRTALKEYSFRDKSIEDVEELNFNIDDMEPFRVSDYPMDKFGNYIKSGRSYMYYDNGLKMQEKGKIGQYPVTIKYRYKFYQ